MTKILNIEINYKEHNNLLKQKHFDSKVQQDNLLCIYHNSTMEVFLSQVINNKKHTKTLVQVGHLFKILIE